MPIAELCRVKMPIAELCRVLCQVKCLCRVKCQVQIREIEGDGKNPGSSSPDAVAYLYITGNVTKTNLFIIIYFIDYYYIIHIILNLS